MSAFQFLLFSASGSESRHLSQPSPCYVGPGPSWETEVWSWEGYSSSLKLWSGYLATPKIHSRTELNREHIIKKKCSYTKTVYTPIYIFLFSATILQFLLFSASGSESRHLSQSSFPGTRQVRMKFIMCFSTAVISSVSQSFLFCGLRAKLEMNNKLV